MDVGCDGSRALFVRLPCLRLCGEAFVREVVGLWGCSGRSRHVAKERKREESERGEKDGVGILQRKEEG